MAYHPNPSFEKRTTAVTEDRQIEKIRALIADYLDVDVKLVTDEAYFTEDLGAGWLDRLELMMLIEDQFAGIEISDDDVDQIEVVGDLIRCIESVDNAKV
jgi:acyl carrier protein